VRTYTRLPITLRIGPRGNAVERIGSTVDVSLHGARILTNVELTAGQTLEIFSYGGKTRPVRARVVWMRVSNANPSIEAGLEFLD
jgi:hypothetical protein